MHALAARNRGAAITALLKAGMPSDFRLPALIAEEEHIRELTPLARAVSRGHLQAATALLAGNADPNIPVGVSQMTPLHLAARRGSTEMVQLLLDAGADPRRRDAVFNATPAGFATHFGHEALAGLLETGRR